MLIRKATYSIVGACHRVQLEGIDGNDGRPLYHIADFRDGQIDGNGGRPLYHIADFRDWQAAYNQFIDRVAQAMEQGTDFNPSAVIRKIVEASDRSAAAGQAWVSARARVLALKEHLKRAEFAFDDARARALATAAALGGREPHILFDRGGLAVVADHVRGEVYVALRAAKD